MLKNLLEVSGIEVLEKSQQQMIAGGRLIKNCDANLGQQCHTSK
ncbi:hypothetical protein [Aquimarina algicola]|nr:hypothetical protein [Aquimarina algicola]